MSSLFSIAFWSAGIVDASELLTNLEEAIVKAKEEVASRKDIMSLMEKWMSACEEEGWLEDYNKVRDPLFRGLIEIYITAQEDNMSSCKN